MSARGKARNRALDVLFEAEQRSVSAFDVLRARREKTDQIVNPYTLEIVEGVVSHQAAIDEFLETYSQGWTLERMPSVDRIILRIGTWELLYNDDVPDGVAVSEAVALAKTLSTDESPSVHQRPPGPPAAAEAVAARLSDPADHTAAAGRDRPPPRRWRPVLLLRPAAGRRRFSAATAARRARIRCSCCRSSAWCSCTSRPLRIRWRVKASRVAPSEVLHLRFPAVAGGPVQGSPPAASGGQQLHLRRREPAGGGILQQPLPGEPRFPPPAAG